MKYTPYYNLKSNCDYLKVTCTCNTKQKNIISITGKNLIGNNNIVTLIMI